MKKLKIAGLFMVILAAILAGSCSRSASTDRSSYANPELWKVLQESDWAAWSGSNGCEMKFVGDNKAISMEWKQDTVTKVWHRTGSDVGAVKFVDENWFVVHFNGKSTAYLFTKLDYTFENSDGAIFRKSQINSFRVKNQ
ncbi:MAG: hypothetical protein NTW16_03530 [Bacteroidetes bacterium]|nr:hypothetical protein [Bacteroidota bacterium]